MSTISEEEMESIDKAEFLACTLIRGAILQYMSRGGESECLLREEIITPYEDGEMESWGLGQGQWVVPHAYLAVATCYVKRENYEEAMSLLKKAAAVRGEFPFAQGLAFNIKNTRDYVDRKLGEEKQEFVDADSGS